MRRSFVALALLAVTVMTSSVAIGDDHQISRQIVQRLQQEQAAGNLQGFGIDLKVVNGVVMLRGRVSTAQQEQLVQQIASSTPGVKDVQKQIAVTPPALSSRARKQTASATPVTSRQVRSTPLPPVATVSRPPVSLPLVGSHRARTVLAVQNQTPVLAPVLVPTQAPFPVAAIAVTSPAFRSQASGQAAPATPSTSRRARSTSLPSTPISTMSRPSANPLLAGSGQVHSVALAQNQTPVLAPIPAPLKASVAAPVQQPHLIPAMAAPPAAAPQYYAAAPQYYAAAPQYYAAAPQYYAAAPQRPVAFAQAGYSAAQYGSPAPIAMAGHRGAPAAQYDHPNLPAYSWPSYAAHPNYGAVTYPKQYSPTAWPYIGPFYPYPQVPLGWRKVTLEWDDGWWQLDFKNKGLH